MLDPSPRRRLAAPFLAALFVCFWFLNREVGIRVARDVAMDRSVVAALAVAAVAVSYAVAVIVTTRLPSSQSLPALFRPLVVPSNATLALVCIASAALGLFVFVSPTFPSPLDAVARAVGVLFGWPALLAVLVSIVVSGLFAPSSLAVGLEFAFIALGVSLSALWLFVLSGLLVRLAGADATA